jgi:hypothetical protein
LYWRVKVRLRSLELKENDCSHRSETVAQIGNLRRPQVNNLRY